MTGSGEAESGEAERRLSQAMAAAMSVALSIGVQVVRQQVMRAREAQQRSEEEQRQIARQLAAQRETAAVLWSRVDDREWIRTQPEQVAEAWGSARAWEQFDPRAAEARAKLDFLIDGLYGAQHPLVRVSRESEDFLALAQLLNRAVDVAPEQQAEVHYELVPEHERQQWLERVVYGPDTPEDTRIAYAADLEAVQAGLPVAVLRELDAETLGAVIARRQQSPEERLAWQREWLHREIWGPDTPEDVRRQRQAQLAELEASGEPKLTADAWQAWLEEHRRRSEQQGYEFTSAAAVRSEPGRQEATAAEPGLRGATDDERQARMAGIVREVWPEHVAERVVNAEAFGAFAYRLHQLEDRGWPPTEVLGMVPAENLVGVDHRGDPVRDSAAYGEYHYLEQLVRSLPERNATDVDAGLARLEKFVHDNAPAGSGRQSPVGETTATAHQAADDQREAAGADHARADDERGAATWRSEVGKDPDVSYSTRSEAIGDADRHGDAAVEYDAAAGGHETLAEDLHRGAYDSAPDPAPRDAGKGYPISTRDALDGGGGHTRQPRQGRAPGRTPVSRPSEHQRGR